MGVADNLKLPLGVVMGWPVAEVFLWLAFYEYRAEKQDGQRG